MGPLFVAASRLWRRRRRGGTSPWSRPGAHAGRRGRLHGGSGAPFGASEQRRDRRLSAPTHPGRFADGRKSPAVQLRDGEDAVVPPSQGGPESGRRAHVAHGRQARGRDRSRGRDRAGAGQSNRPSPCPPPATPKPGPEDPSSGAQTRPPAANLTRPGHFGGQGQVQGPVERPLEPAPPSFARTAARVTERPPTPTTAAFSVRCACPQVRVTGSGPNERRAPRDGRQEGKSRLGAPRGRGAEAAWSGDQSTRAFGRAILT